METELFPPHIHLIDFRIDPWFIPPPLISIDRQYPIQGFYLCGLFSTEYRTIIVGTSIESSNLKQELAFVQAKRRLKHFHGT